MQTLPRDHVSESIVLRIVHEELEASGARKRIAEAGSSLLRLYEEDMLKRFDGSQIDDFKKVTIAFLAALKGELLSLSQSGERYTEDSIRDAARRARSAVEKVYGYEVSTDALLFLAILVDALASIQQPQQTSR